MENFNSNFWCLFHQSLRNISHIIPHPKWKEWCQYSVPAGAKIQCNMSREVSKKSLDELPMSECPAVSSTLLARRSERNSRDSYQGEPLLKVNKDLQKSRGSWCEIREATRFLQQWEKWRERNYEKNHRFWISTCNQLCAKIPFPLQWILRAQVLGSVFVTPQSLCSSCRLKEEQAYCFLLTKMI